MMRRALLTLLLACLPFGNAWALNCSSNPFTLTNNQVADATQVMSNFNNLLSCANTNLAHSGANSDITSLSGLSTPLSTSQGGSGVASPTANNVLLGNGASAFQVVPPMTSGNVLRSDGTTWASSSNGAPICFSTGGVTVAGGLTQYIGIGTVQPLETNVFIPASVPGAIHNMFAQASTAPTAGQNYIFTFRKNGVNTTLVSTISNAASSGSDLTHSVTVATTDIMTLQVATSGGAATAIFNVCFAFNASP